MRRSGASLVAAAHGAAYLELSLSTVPFDKPFDRLRAVSMAEPLRVVSKAEPLKALSLSKGNSRKRNNGNGVDRG